MVEVTVTGPVDPATGMIAHLGDLDSYVTREIIEPFDHTYLNKDVEAFRDRVPTTENFCMEIFERLKGFPGCAFGAYPPRGDWPKQFRIRRSPDW